MKNFFRYDNPIFLFINTVADLVIANVLTLLCCVPVVTIGAALAANHKIVQNIIFHEDGALLRTFFKTFQENLKSASLLWLAQLLLLVVLGFNAYLVLIYFDGSAKTILITMFVIFAVMIIGICAMIFPLLVRYDNKLSEHFLNAILLFFKKLPIALVMVALHISPVVFFAMVPSMFIRTLPFWILGSFSLIFLLENLLLKSTFLQLETLRDSSKSTTL